MAGKYQLEACQSHTIKTIMGKSVDVTRVKFVELVKELARYTEELEPVWSSYSSCGMMSIEQFAHFLRIEQKVC